MAKYNFSLAHIGDNYLGLWSKVIYCKTFKHSTDTFILSVTELAGRLGQLICCVTVLLVWLKGLWQRRWKAIKEGEQQPAVTQRDHNGHGKSHSRLILFLLWLQPPANWLVIPLLTCQWAGWHREPERTLSHSVVGLDWFILWAIHWVCVDINYTCGFNKRPHCVKEIIHLTRNRLVISTCDPKNVKFSVNGLASIK